jgi:hypothetical protein
MTMLSDADLAAFVTTSAIVLGLRLDDAALAAVTDAMRGVLGQAALVLDCPPASTTP